MENFIWAKFEDFNPGTQHLRKFWELLCLLEVKTQLCKFF